MAAEKKYASLDFYEKKLEKIMMRFGIEKKDYNWNCDRYGGWVEFRYKGQIYRFEHTVDNAKKAGINLTYGSDAFAQIVLALEDLARIVERGIYDLQNWVAGMKMLPEKTTLPSFCSVLGLDHYPASEEEVIHQYRNLAKIFHTDKGGSTDDFTRLTEAKEQALQYLKASKPDS